MTLFRQFFMAQLKGLLIWMAVGALFALAGTRTATTFVESDAMAKMPKVFLDLMGDVAGLSTVDAYMAVAVAKGTVLIPVLYAVIQALSVVTREVDRRTVEFLLALPVQRSQVLLARVAVLAVNVIGVVASIWAVWRFDMAAQGYLGTWGHLGLVFLNLWLLSFAVGAITLAGSMWIDDYSVGVKLFLGIASLSFLVEYALRAVGASRTARLISPFSYVNPAEVMRTGSIPPGDAAVLAVIIVAGLAVSFRAFDRKQFSA